MDNTSVEHVTANVKGDGSILVKVGFSTFGLLDIKSSRGGNVTYVPDPDNTSNTIIWVTGIEGVDSKLPEGSATLTLEYAGE